MNCLKCNSPEAAHELSEDGLCLKCQFNECQEIKLRCMQLELENRELNSFRFKTQTGRQLLKEVLNCDVCGYRVGPHLPHDLRDACIGFLR